MAAPMKRCFLVKFRFFAFAQIHTGISCQSSFEKSKYMQKLLKKGEKKSVKWFGPTNYKGMINSGSHGETKKKRQYSDHMLRRSQWLSVVFFDELSQAINAGVLDRHVNVMKVEVVPDMSTVKVFWEASGNREQDDDMQEYLNKHATYLRHELIQAQVLARVPHLAFVKDLSAAKERELQELFKNLDTGPPDVNVEEETDLDNLTDADDSDIEKLADDTELELLDSDRKMVVSDSDIERVPKLLDTENTGTDDIDEIGGQFGRAEKQEGEFRQDIYGLQHDVLMSKVTSSSSKIRPVIESDGTEGTVNFKDSRFADKIVLKKEKPINFKKHKKRLMQEYLDEERLSNGMLENDKNKD